MRVIQLTGANQVIAAAANPVVYWRGFSIRETTGAASALVRVWDNPAAAAGTILDEIALAPGESARECYNDPAPTGVNGCYLQVVSGAVAGSVRVD